MNFLELMDRARLADLDAQKWARAPGGERLAALRARDATTLRAWARSRLAASPGAAIEDQEIAPVTHSAAP